MLSKEYDSPYHFQRSTKNSAQNVGVPQLILRPSIVRQLHEIGKRILVKQQAERLPSAITSSHTFSNPPHRWRHIQEYLKSHFTYHLRRLSEAIALPSVRFGEVVFDQAKADVVAHPV
jgi:hypothetical protein